MINPGRFLIFLGLFFIGMGSFLLCTDKIVPFLGRLPGDVVFTRKNISLFVPFTTMFVVSLLLTLIMSFFSRWMK